MPKSERNNLILTFEDNFWGWLAQIGEPFAVSVMKHMRHLVQRRLSLEPKLYYQAAYSMTMLLWLVT